MQFLTCANVFFVREKRKSLEEIGEEDRTLSNGIITSSLDVFQKAKVIVKSPISDASVTGWISCHANNLRFFSGDPLLTQSRLLKCEVKGSKFQLIFPENYNDFEEWKMNGNTIMKNVICKMDL